jgi:hypothetical protein
MDPLDIHGSIHGFMDVDVPLGSMDVDVTNIHGYPSSAFTAKFSVRGLSCHFGIGMWSLLS